MILHQFIYVVSTTVSYTDTVSPQYDSQLFLLRYSSDAPPSSSVGAIWGDIKGLVSAESGLHVEEGLVIAGMGDNESRASHSPALSPPLAPSEKLLTFSGVVVRLFGLPARPFVGCAGGVNPLYCCRGLRPYSTAD